ncbi:MULTISPECIES: protein kinase domain-containing protein [unclassified Nocardioides]|uniref:protein kinase domain-containing protein n=1 Tax=unclassified Nocardioides TaxID=2615069 RepID=UPI0006FF9A1A|nr:MULTISPECIES: protein kinase [unclassified Nocardioides]KQY57020.1 hypothetical protein ASD30_12205 [Nocardioides sp. Root140]KRF13144.1 hypothetical protein ASH02_16850 [Nocardioides sp. Soil796]
MPLPRTGDLFGRYRIDAQLGTGGMGVVHRAHDTELGRTVALKVMWPHLATDEGFRTRFLNEATTLAKVDSTHIVAIYDHGVHDDVLYITTQYVEGGDLGAVLEQRGSLPRALAARVCVQIAGALHDAHRAGVVHRDVKPANVLLRSADSSDTTEPQAYLCDFGVAQTQWSRGLTMTGTVAGTWSWLAPERAQGSPGTPASDIYSLGCVLWACLNAGAAPYTGPDVEVAAAHLTEPIPQLPGDDPLTRRFNDLLDRSLAKHPKDRFRTAAAFRDQLLAVARAADQSGAATTTTAPRRRRGRLVAAVTAGALVLGGAGFGVQRLLAAEDEPTADPGRSSAGGADRRPLVTGDVDGDRLGDLMFDRDRPGRTSLETTMTSTADGFSRPRGRKASKGSVYLGDVDGDQRLDLVDITRLGKVQDRTDVPLSIKVRHGGSETTTHRVTVPNTGKYVWEMLGDFDGDGRDDIGLSTDRSPGVIELWVVPATDDGFGEPVSWARIRGLGKSVSNAMLPGDFDGDGKSDLAVERSYGSKVAKSGLLLIRSSGTAFGQPGPARVTPENTFTTGSVAPGDFDGDGTDELSLLVDTQGDQEVRVFRASGDRFDAGESWVVTPPGIVNGSFTDTVASDVDGNGRDDLVRLDRWNTEPWQIDVLISEGTNFAQPSHATAFDCAKTCEWYNGSIIGPFALQ